MSEFQVGQILTWKNIDGVDREGTLLKQDPMNGFDLVQPADTSLDLHQLLVARSELRPALPRAGDLVRVVKIADYDIDGAKLKVGDECELNALEAKERFSAAEPKPEEGGPVLLVGGMSFVCVILIRRAGTPAAEEVRCYGTMPDVLPETLPVGTKFRNQYYNGKFTGTARLEGRLYVGAMIYSSNDGATRDESSSTGHAQSSWVCWDSVPIQPSPAAEVAKGDRLFDDGCVFCGRDTEHGAVIWNRGATGCEHPQSCRDCRDAIAAPAEHDSYAGMRSIKVELVRRKSLRPISPPPVGSADAATRKDAARDATGRSNTSSAQPAGGGSSKVDPYARGRELDAFAAAVGRPGLTFPPEVHEFVAWQAKQRRHLEQDTRDLDRPVSAHPRSFPERAFDDADELYPTY